MNSAGMYKYNKLNLENIIISVSAFGRFSRKFALCEVFKIADGGVK